MLPKITFLSDTCPKSCGRWVRLGRVKLSLGFRRPKKRKGSVFGRSGLHPRKPRFARAPHPPSERDEGLRSRAEAAIADARKSHERLRQAIDILPQGIVFLDAEGRYVLWNKQYAEIYSKIAELLRRLYQPGARHEQKLADGRVILIDERLTDDGGVVGLRVDITELKQREASFRLLFDGNPVPMIVCALDDERILGVNDAAISHYGYSRAEFEKLTIRSLQALESEPPWMADPTCEEQAARTWKHVKADGALIDLAIYSRELTYADRPAVLLALMDITERKRAEARLAFMAQHDT